MTKKHFILLAQFMANTTLSEEALKALLAFCKASNPRFDEVKFMEYMGNCRSK